MRRRDEPAARQNLRALAHLHANATRGNVCDGVGPTAAQPAHNETSARARAREGVRVDKPRAPVGGDGGREAHRQAFARLRPGSVPEPAAWGE